MHVIGDHRGGLWLYCTSCLFSGGFLELAMKKRRCDALTASKWLAEHSKYVSAARALTGRDLAAAQAYIEHRGKISAWWDKAKDGQTAWKADPELIGNLNKIEVWPGYRYWATTTSRYGGMTTGRMLKTYFGRAVAAQLTIGQDIGAFVVRWEDLPGRVVGLETIDRTRTARYCALYGRGAEDAGLYRPGLLLSSEPIVYGLNDTLTAVWLCNNSLLNNREIPPVVVWRPDTRESWYSIRANTLILWEPMVTARTFQPLRYVKNAYISTLRPRAEDYVTRKLSDTDLFLSELRATARPWEQVFKEHALKLAHPELLTFLTEVNLTVEHQQTVLEACTPDERNRLLKYWQLELEHRQISIDGIDVSIRDGKWFYRRSASRAEHDALLTEATIHIHTIIRYESTAQTFMVGEIRYRDRVVQFNVEELLFRRAPAQYVQDALVKEGIGYPSISQTGRRRDFLVDIAIAISRPSVVVANETYGWDGRQRKFVLPQAVVSVDGVVDTSITVASPETTPGYRIKHAVLTPTLVSNWFRPTLVCHTTWAVLAAMLRNLVAHISGTSVRSIGIYGSAQTVGGIVYRGLMRQFDLMEFVLDNEEAQPLSQSHMHGSLPYGVRLAELECVPAFSAWRDSRVEALQFMTLTSPKLASLLSVSPNWDFIACPSVTAAHRVPTLDGFMTNAIRHLLTVTWDDELTTYQMLQALETMLGPMVADRTSQMIMAEVFTAARALTRMDTPYGPVRDEYRLLFALYRLLDDGDIDLGTHESNAVITADPEPAFYRIWAGRLLSAIRSKALPVPTDLAEHLDLIRASDLCVGTAPGAIDICSEQWAVSYKDWQTRKSDPSADVAEQLNFKPI